MQVVESTQIPIWDVIQPCDFEGYYPPSSLLEEMDRNGFVLRLGHTKIIADDKEVWYEDIGNRIKLYDTQQ